MLSQPRRQLRFLLRLQIDAVVNALNGLFVSTLRRSDFVSGEKLRHLVARCRVTENAGRSYDLRTGKRTTSFFHFTPMLANEIPCQLLACRIPHHAGDNAQRILRSDVGRNRKVQRALQQSLIRELRKREQIPVVFLRRLRILQRGHYLVVVCRIAIERGQSQSAARQFAIHGSRIGQRLLCHFVRHFERLRIASIVAHCAQHS